LAGFGRRPRSEKWGIAVAIVHADPPPIAKAAKAAEATLHNLFGWLVRAANVQAMFDPLVALSHIALLLTLCLRLFAQESGRAPAALARTEAALACAIRATAADAGIVAPDLDDAALIAWFHAAGIAPVAPGRDRAVDRGATKSGHGQSVF